MTRCWLFRLPVAPCLYVEWCHTCGGPSSEDVVKCGQGFSFETSMERSENTGLTGCFFYLFIKVASCVKYVVIVSHLRCLYILAGDSFVLSMRVESHLIFSFIILVFCSVGSLVNIVVISKETSRMSGFRWDCDSLVKMSALFIMIFSFSDKRWKSIG